MLTALPLVFALSVSGLVAPVRSEPALTSLGVLMHGVRTVGGAVGTDHDGRAWAYTVSTGSPAVFNVVDVTNGQVARSFPLDGAADSYGVAVAPDRRVYLTTTNTGRLYRYTPGASAIEDLGRPVPSQTHLYRLAFDEQGRVYAGTYPGARVIRYDPATGDYRDYGQVLAGMQYVRSVAVHGGTLYAGTQPEAHLVAIDIETGAKREIPLPDAASGVAVLYDLTVVGDLLFARASPTGVTGTLFVYDLASGAFVDQFSGANGLETSPMSPGGLVYFMKDSELTGYHPATRTLRPTGFRWPGTVTQIRGAGFVELDEPDFPGRSLVGMNWSGDVFWYNPTTSATRLVNSSIAGQPVRIRALATGPGGRVYAGGTGIGALATFDPRTDRVDAHRFSEVQGMAQHGERVYVGAYPRARVYAHDPAAPWNSPEYSPGPPGVPANPNLLFAGDADQQDRPFAITSVEHRTSVGPRIAVGTVPRTGLLGGRLRIYDPRTGQSTIHRDLVPDQSITALAYRDGILYGGTSVYGGFGSTPTQTEAKLFAWEVATGRLLWTLIPVPGDRTVSSLSWDRRGRLWGVTAGAVFQYDPGRRTTTWRRYADYTWPTQGAYDVAEIAYNRVDDRLYAAVANVGLVRLHPNTWSPEVLSDRSVDQLVVHRSGEVYVSDDAELLRYRPWR